MCAAKKKKLHKISEDKIRVKTPKVEVKPVNKTIRYSINGVNYESSMMSTTMDSLFKIIDDIPKDIDSYMDNLDERMCLLQRDIDSKINKMISDFDKKYGKL